MEITKSLTLSRLRTIVGHYDEKAIGRPLNSKLVSKPEVSATIAPREINDATIRGVTPSRIRNAFVCSAQQTSDLELMRHHAIAGSSDVALRFRKNPSAFSTARSGTGQPLARKFSAISQALVALV